jgi:hypothetical protein
VTTGAPGTTNSPGAARRVAPVVLCVLVGAVCWLTLFDLYVSRGAREYLQKQAEHELGLGAEPSMADVMQSARRDGAVAASWLGGFATVSGLVAVRLARNGSAAGRRIRRAGGPDGRRTDPKDLTDAGPEGRRWL